MFPILDAAISSRITEEVTKVPGIRMVDLVITLTHILVEDGTGRPIDLLRMIQDLVDDGTLIQVTYQTNANPKPKALLFPRFTEIQISSKV